MKKLFIIFLSLFLFIPAFCYENKYYLGEKYKKEITKIIDKEYPKVIKAIDDVFVEFEKEKEPYEKGAIIDWGIPSIMFYFFDTLIKETNKYLPQPLPQLETDWNYALEMQIMPYLKNNRIDRTKIKSLRKYADKKQREIEKKTK